MNAKSVNVAIRAAVTKAVILQKRRGPFLLSGRGHEPRVTLDRSLAATLRKVEIPFVYISGFGPNHFYPQRIFVVAKSILIDTLGWSPIEVSGCECRRNHRKTNFETPNPKTKQGDTSVLLK